MSAVDIRALGATSFDTFPMSALTCDSTEEETSMGVLIEMNWQRCGMTSPPPSDSTRSLSSYTPNLRFGDEDKSTQTVYDFSPGYWGLESRMNLDITNGSDDNNEACAMEELAKNENSVSSELLASGGLCHPEVDTPILE